jgi:hypothetical protein
MLPHNTSQLGVLNKNSSVCDNMADIVDENIILFLGYHLLIKKKKKDQQENVGLSFNQFSSIR